MLRGFDPHPPHALGWVDEGHGLGQPYVVRLASWRRTRVVRLERLVVLGQETLLDGSGGPTVRLPCRPDRRAARRATADLRHVRWVRVHLGDGEVSAEVFAAGRRPIRRRVPVPAALALAEAGMPTLLARDEDA